MEKKLSSLCANEDDLIKDPDWEDYRINVIDFILSLCPARWSSQQISRALGMIRLNAYAVEVGDLANFGMVRLLFPTLSMMYVLTHYVFNSTLLFMRANLIGISYQEN